MRTIRREHEHAEFLSCHPHTGDGTAEKQHVAFSEFHFK